MGVRSYGNRRPWGCLILVVYCLYPFWVLAQDLEPTPEPLQRGIERLGQGDLEGAEKVFREAIILAPEDANAHFYLGFVLQRKGQVEEALEAYQRALSIDPTHLRSHYHLGLLYEGMGRLEEAVGEYRAVIQLGGESAFVQQARSRLAQIGETPEMVRRVQQLLEEGRTQLQEGNLEEAEKTFEAVLRLVPENLPAHFSLGIIFTRKNQAEASIQAYLRVLSIDPRYLPARYNLGLLYEDQKRMEEAIIQYQAILQLGAGTPLAQDARARLEQTGETPEMARKIQDHLATSQEALVQGDFEKVRQQAEEALKIAPKNLGAHEVLGIVHYRQGNIDLAISAFRQILSIDPENLSTMLRLGFVYEGRGQFNEAAGNYLSLIRKGGDSPPAQVAKVRLAGVLQELTQRRAIKELALHFNKGIQYAERGELDLAIQEFGQAEALDPNDPYIAYNLGLVYGQKNEYDKAIPKLEKAVELKPDYVPAQFRLGVIYEALWASSFFLPEPQREELRTKARKAYEAVVSSGQGELEVAGAKDRLAVLEQAISSEQEVKGHLFLSRALFQDGRLDEAIAQTLIAVEKFPASPTIHHQLGFLYEQKGMEEEAVQAYQKALESNPLFKDSYLRLAFIYEKRGQWQEALNAYEQAAKINPSDPIPHYGLALLYERQERYREAQAEYKNFLTLAKEEGEATRAAQDRLKVLERLLKKYNLSFSQSMFTYDSNVTSSSTDHQSEISTGFNLSLAYLPLRKTRWSLNFGLSNNSTQRFRLQTFISSTSATADFLWDPWPDYQLGLGYGVTYIQTNSGPASYNQAFNSRINRTGTFPARATLSLSFERLTSLISSDFDTFRQTYSLTASQGVGRIGNFNFSYGLSLSDVNRRDQSALSHTFSIGYFTAFFKKLSANLGYTYSLIDFFNPQLIPTVGGPPARITRQNTFQSLRISGSYLFKRGLTLSLEYHYQFNRSNIGLAASEEVEALLTEQVRAQGGFNKSLVSLRLSQSF